MGLAQARERADALEGTRDGRVRVQTRTKFSDALLHFPPLQTKIIDPTSMLLEQAVNLVALAHATDAQSRPRLLQPLGARGLICPFSRTWKSDQALYDVLRSGFATISTRTPSRYVQIRDGQLLIDFAGVFWKPAPILLSQVRSIIETAHKPRWPTKWAADVPNLAKTLAEGEIRLMINECASWFGWPRPDNAKQVERFVNTALTQVPLSIVMRCLLKGAVAAETARTRYRGTKPRRWSNNMIIGALRTLDNHLLGNGDIQPARRRIPRTAVDVALWEQMLHKQDDGYDKPLSAIRFPM